MLSEIMDTLGTSVRLAEGIWPYPECVNLAMIWNGSNFVCNPFNHIVAPNFPVWVNPGSIPRGTKLVWNSRTDSKILRKSTLNPNKFFARWPCEVLCNPMDCVLAVPFWLESHLSLYRPWFLLRFSTARINVWQPELHILYAAQKHAVFLRWSIRRWDFYRIVKPARLFMVRNIRQSLLEQPQSMISYDQNQRISPWESTRSKQKVIHWNQREKLSWEQG